MIYLLLIFPILFTLEGVREWKFYQINRAAKFQPKAADVDRKFLNGILSAAYVIPLLYLAIQTNLYDYPAALVYVAACRWLLLDGALNLLRGLGFWYAGNSGRSITDRILYPLSIPARAALKILLVVIPLFLLLL